MIEVQPYIEKLKEGTKVGTNTSYHYLDDPLSIEYEYGVMLMEAIAKNKPKSIVEIGTGNGYSTSWIILGSYLAGGAIFHTWDLVDRSGQIWKKLELDHLNSLVRHYGKLEELDMYVDFLFHDAQHKLELIVEDLEKALPFMKEKSQIWVHDAGGNLGIALKDWFKSKGWTSQVLEEGCGMLIADKN